jgi:hypothetical protein
MQVPFVSFYFFLALKDWDLIGFNMPFKKLSTSFFIAHINKSALHYKKKKKKKNY